ncbi:LOW QUALITY PROTEIN: folate synthesis bifunctional protein-like [Phalaenopsis equestris]|uniref:LOW QUALITY PROTEIN: folate synthesis bifunctional protein-like n=1 Tax=Phalaenopsis equestris TaxID=78828 RepID=UPI0009E1DFFA|nr:LOW QUALITY PROTEIN: folate synthesis bifunctional protein-like [Phalaenopsis equestris]
MCSSGVLEPRTLFSHMGVFDRIHPIFTRRITQLRHWSSSRESKLRIFSGCSSQCTLTQKASFSSPSMSSVQSPINQEVVIALGSNVGDRIKNFNRALQLMKESGIQISSHGCLYESEPAYVTDQPLFLNSAVRGTTRFGPFELLKVLKQIEKQLGRTDGIRYGPRPIDLDILFYGSHRFESEILTIPHERIWERPFVLAPLIDLLGTNSNRDIEAIWNSFSGCNGGIFEQWQQVGGEISIEREGLRRVMPIGTQLWDWMKRTHVMGVLNLTPDSFSDGGKFYEVPSAVSHIKQLISEGADIIDIGAQSTRPFARRLSASEELRRLLIPVLDSVMQIPEIEGKLLSVDTFYAEVAYEAVKRGVHIVNDVSGGQLDPDILAVVGELEVPFIIMHMRGDPCTMQSEENLQYEDVCEEVASELYACVSKAELSGIPMWRIIVDPGIGFAKQKEHNLDILMNLPSIRKEIGKRSLGASRAPLMVGPSRKRFLGDICGRVDAAERDPATIAVATAAILGGANIIRVHNVKDMLDAAKVCDALRKRKGVRGISESHEHIGL